MTFLPTYIVIMLGLFITGVSGDGYYEGQKTDKTRPELLPVRNLRACPRINCKLRRLESDALLAKLDIIPHHVAMQSCHVQHLP